MLVDAGGVAGRGAGRPRLLRAGAQIRGGRGAVAPAALPLACWSHQQQSHGAVVVLDRQGMLCCHNKLASQYSLFPPSCGGGVGTDSPCPLQIGFMAGGGLLGLMLLNGFNWQALFYAVSALAVLQSLVLFALVPADSPYSLSPATEETEVCGCIDQVQQFVPDAADGASHAGALPCAIAARAGMPDVRRSLFSPLPMAPPGAMDVETFYHATQHLQIQPPRADTADRLGALVASPDILANRGAGSAGGFKGRGLGDWQVGR